ncbi:MAG: DNA topoisomerase III [Planctomycetota bacterium]|nr:MAG: DNA topoisomerase III [Planctomycetota bacterium]
MQLVIAEKPSVAEDLTRVLPGPFHKREGYWEGPEHVMSYALGHLLELAQPEDYDPGLKRWSLEQLPILPGSFRRKARSGQTRHLQLLKKLAQRPEVESVVNACDAAREGELIFREIEEFLGVRKPVYRLWLQSMTPAAIREAFARLKPSAAYDGLADAAYSRSEADWLIGMNATRAITRRLKGRKEKGVWSAGRVQTPTLALLVHRELKVLAHVAVPYWRLRGDFQAAGHSYAGLYKSSRSGRDAEKIWDRHQAEAIRAACLGRPAEVVEQISESTRPAPALHSLTSLQKEANSRYGLSASRTLGAAQRLYEQHKALTYPRTDSNALPSDYRPHVQQVLAVLSQTHPGDLFSDTGRAAAIPEAARQLRTDGLRNEARVFDDARVSDHFAVIPTGVLPASPLGGDDAKVFELVLRRFLAAFLPPSVWQKVARETRIRPAGDSATEPTLHVFYTESDRLVQPGWQLVDRRPAASELLGDLGVPPGTPAAGSTREVKMEEDLTRPPARYTEAGLLKAMEEAGDIDLDQHEEIEDEEAVAALKLKGLGTPATRADIIEGLIEKGYVLRTGKSLRPTAKGIILIDFLERIRAENLAKAELTAEMEFHLLQVERGQRERASYMGEIESSVRELVEKLRNFEYDELFQDEQPLGRCPVDGAPVREGLRGYSCKKEGHSWTLWKEFRGRYINRPVAEKLLAERDSGPLEGFVNLRGQPYSGRLKLSNGDAPALEFEPVKDLRLSDEDGAAPEPELVSFPVDPAPLGPCPKCGKGQVVETATHYQCRQEDGKSCGLTIPRAVCKRELKRADVAPYFDPATGSTDWIEDFISRKGRPFTAKLVRKPNGRHGFEFKPREGKPMRGRRKAAAAETPPETAAAAPAATSAEAPAKTARKPRARKKSAKPPSPPAES